MSFTYDDAFNYAGNGSVLEDPLIKQAFAQRVREDLRRKGQINPWTKALVQGILDSGEKVHNMYSKFRGPIR